MLKQKIDEIKTTTEFYQALRDRVDSLFNGYERVGCFEGLSEQEKKTIFQFGCAVLSDVYNPIQKRYTKQERRKAEKITKEYDDIIAYYVHKFRTMQDQIAELEDKLEKMGVA